MSLESTVTTLKITDLVYRGAGLARIDGKVCFVRGVLPGETVHVRITKEHAKYCEAELLAVNEASADRIRPACPLSLGGGAAPGAPVCAGCAYQHMRYEAELRAKQAQFVSILTHNTGIAPGVIKAPVGSPKTLEYRNKIVLHVGMTDGLKVLGYFAEDNKTVIDVPCCLLAAASIGGLLTRVRSTAGFLDDLEPEDRMTFRFTQKDGPLCWAGKAVSGESMLTESTAIGEIMVPRDGFFQVNGPVADELVKLVQGIVRECKAGYVLDLFSGVGVFALAAAKAGVERVRGVDTDRKAIKAAQANAERLGVKNAEFIVAPASEGMKRAGRDRKGDLITAIVDPPRAGLDRGLLDELCRILPENIIYVSCAADTMARDANVLVKAGYGVVSSRILDMFPRTPYFESVTHFRRNSELKTPEDSDTIAP